MLSEEPELPVPAEDGAVLETVDIPEEDEDEDEVDGDEEEEQDVVVVVVVLAAAAPKFPVLLE